MSSTFCSTARRRSAAVVTAMAMAVAGAVSGCDVPAVGGGDEPVGVTESAAGGTLTAMALGPVQSWDPQRISSRSDEAFAGRVFARTLTAYQHGPDRQSQMALTGDLATDTGSPDQTLRVWTFTLRDGVKWQDGSALTCGDVKYGISRAFATDVITGGLNYAVAYLDIPKTPEGASIYSGPYVEGETAQAGIDAFDKAVACDGADLTIRLSEPVADFPGMVSTLGFAAYKESADKGAASVYTVFSAGPYTLSSPWTPDRGGTFVRNPHWSAASDPIRLALPDQIVYREGLEPQDVAQLIMADEPAARASVALDTAPPAIQVQIAAAEPLRERSVNSLNGLVDYLVPNVKSAVMADPRMRAALALATDRDAYVAALGGPTAAEVTTSILASCVRASLPEPEQAADPTGTGPATQTAPESQPPESQPSESQPSESQSPQSPTDGSGGASTPAGTGTGQPESPAEATSEGTAQATDEPTGHSTGEATSEATGEEPEPESPAETPASDLERAADLVAQATAEAGLETPVPLRVAYRSSRTMDTAMQALQEGWTEAGFAVELQPIADGYFATISAADRATATDVFWSVWAADWNSASTVLPPLFDSRLNVTEAGSGRNYGYFVDTLVDGAMTAALAIPDRDDRNQAWFDIDTTLRSRGAYVALAERKSMYVAGSSVTNLTTHPALGGTVDLAVIGVEP